ncbi:ROK family protein [Virgisporangium aliadipatigenens]|uniref:ROK family protein n=1 Tax=Virgisporangium aliadipatigenens TaxID=741659 RepID=UPI00194494FE|nr:ROK family protein [Virgisporangium aliadipatigenens]
MAETLTIDCGGGGIKASVLDADGAMLADPIRVPTPYPLSTSLFIETLLALARRLPPAARVTVGVPGMIRHGVVVHTPHYITVSGPRSRVDPELRDQWTGFHLEKALAVAFGLPTLVLNDAEVHGADLVQGAGLELVLTLGTGLGCAMFDHGVLAPHLEFSRAPMRWGQTYDTYIGEIERRRLGVRLWSRRMVRVVESLRPVFLWDRLYIGGGNAQLIRAEARAKMGPDVVFALNAAGIRGGGKAWNLVGVRGQP